MGTLEKEDRRRFNQAKSELIMSDRNCILENSMSDKTIENHHVVTMTHELRVDGHHLIEKKQKNLIHGTGKTLVLVHIRSIDDKSYKVTETNNGEDDAPKTQVETDMDEDEVKKFEEDWASLWNPDITKNEMEKLHQ